MPDAFTLRMFVPDGDPEGVRFIDRMNWTGLGIVFPRSKWPEVRNRAEFGRTGVYILTGYSEGDEDLPTVYVGQAAALALSHTLNASFRNRLNVSLLHK